MYLIIGLLALCAVGLTFAMHMTRERMLGFPAAILWFLTGGFSFGQSTVAWDAWFIAGFAFIMLGAYAALAQYGLRERRDTIGDVEMERGEGKYPDEKPGKQDLDFYENDGIPELDDNMRPRTRSVSRRAKSKRKGEFDF